MSLSADSELRIVRPLNPAIDPIAASRLRLSEDRVWRVTFVRIHHGEAFCHTTVCLPSDVGRLLSTSEELNSAGSTSPVTIIGLLDGALDNPIQDAEQSITIGSADDEVAETLGLDTGTSLLRIDRMYFDGVGKPVELAVSHFHPDRYSYRVRLRRSFA
jgi:DNA-binding GntR family transcriptional regulator